MEPEVLIVCGVVLLFIIAINILIPFGTWFKALSAGLSISFVDLMLLKLRKAPYKLIVNLAIQLNKKGSSLKVSKIEKLLLSGSTPDQILNSDFPEEG